MMLDPNLIPDFTDELNELEVVFERLDTVRHAMKKKATPGDAKAMAKLLTARGQVVQALKNMRAAEAQLRATARAEMSAAIAGSPQLLIGDPTT